MQAARIAATVGARRSSQGAVARARGAAMMRGGHGGSPPPTFMRIPAPKETLAEHNDLIWDDGVAPEATVDFDAQNVSTFKGFLMWLAGVGFLTGLYKYVEKVRQPETLAPFAKRDLPDLSEDFGGNKTMAEI